MSTFHILKGNRVVAKADKLGEAEGHPAQKWAESDRKPKIDFGELGNDKTALAKWLSEHPGKTAAFRSAGTVYHACNHGGQVFTVPASRRNGLATRESQPSWDDPRYGLAIKPSAMVAIRKAIAASRKSGRTANVMVDPQGRDSTSWREIVAACAEGEQTMASIDGQVLRVFTPEWNIGITFDYGDRK